MSLLGSQFTCATMKEMLVQGGGACLLQVKNNVSHKIEKPRGRKVISRPNWIQGPEDVVWALCLTVILNSSFYWVVFLILSS